MKSHIEASLYRTIMNGVVMSRHEMTTGVIWGKHGIGEHRSWFHDDLFHYMSLYGVLLIMKHHETESLCDASGVFTMEKTVTVYSSRIVQMRRRHTK